MNNNQKGSHKALIAFLSVILSLLIIGCGGIILYLALHSEPKQTAKKSAQRMESEEETETFSEADTSLNTGTDGNDELYCEEIAKEHIAFDQDSGLQYADDQLLITAAQGIGRDDVEKIIDSYQAEIVGMIGATNIYQIKFPDPYSKEELKRIGEELILHREIESYEINTIMNIDISAVYPDDKEWENEWGDSTPAGINWGMEAIHAPEAWEHFKDMKEVNVGVYDNMFYNHTDLEFKDILCNMQGDELDNSHGTHVSGTIGAKYNNDEGVCGVFPKAQLYGASFEKIGKSYDDIMGIKIAFTYLIDQEKCKAINMSLGWNEIAFAASRGNENALNAIENGAQQIGDYLQILLNLDPENDFVICKSAGNNNSTECFIEADENDEDAPYGYILYNNDNKERYKKYEGETNFEDRIVCASDVGCVQSRDLISSISNKGIRERILVVGAAENLGNGQYKVADFSNCGYRVDVLAPGVEICSTVEKNKYEWKKWDGTSMAAPHVTGVAAMCFSVNEKLNGAQVADIIRNTAEGSITYTIDNGAKQFGGYPMVNAEKAVEKALATKGEDEEVRKKNQKDNITRDVVLVLDRSGSMSGYPMEQTKEASLKFIDTVFEKESRVAVVSYDDEAVINCGLTDNQQELETKINEIYDGGSTNMYAGLEQADSILQNSQADKKIIVLMSDGLPNEGMSDGGDYSAPLIRYAEEMKNRGYIIYTLGFFTDVYGYDLSYAQQLMEGIASPRLHYEVNSAEDLVFFFDDIANQIAGTEFVYIRIACPVDVTVSSGDEILSSKADSENTRTSFGALTYESIQDESENEEDDSENSYFGNYGADDFYEEAESEDQAKILRLNMDKDYDVEIEGYGSGKMDYTVSFPDENGEYNDVREFPNIAVTASTKATSNTSASDATYLKVDEDGDGKIDTTYKTEANGKMEEVKDNKVLYIILIVLSVVIVLVVVLIAVLVHLSGKKKRASAGTGKPVGEIYGAFGIFRGQSYPMRPGQQCVVGRKSSCNIQLVHGEVSRTHCMIEMLPDGVYQVTDYSTNGTFYNDMRLKSGEPYRLPKGALLAIGDADNVLELK